MDKLRHFGASSSFFRVLRCSALISSVVVGVTERGNDHYVQSARNSSNSSTLSRGIRRNSIEFEYAAPKIEFGSSYFARDETDRSCLAALLAITRARFMLSLIRAETIPFAIYWE